MKATTGLDHGKPICLLESCKTVNDCLYWLEREKDQNQIDSHSPKQIPMRVHSWIEHPELGEAVVQWARIQRPVTGYERRSRETLPCYEIILRRVPDEEGKRYYLKMLRGGAARYTIVEPPRCLHA